MPDTPSTIIAGMNRAEKACPECDGCGWIVITVPACCRRSEWECGGRGCTGPEPEQAQDSCPACQGTGTLLKDQTNDDD